MTISSIAEIEFAANPEPRCPCVLLLDTSGSMDGAAISALNAGLKEFSEDILSDRLASLRIELAIITFDSTVLVARDFATLDEIITPTLTAQGGTDLAAGIEKALDMIAARKATYKSAGIPYYRPWVFMVTDGVPTASYEQSSARLREAEEQKRLSFFAIGVEGADMDFLRRISVREPKMLKGLRFREMFVWLSASMKAVSRSRPGDLVALPPTTWEAI